jgi:phage-related protein
MATQTFTWAPLVQPVGTITYRVLKAQFGDGYAQTGADGINNETQSWPLVFRGLDSKISAIRDFIRARQGYQSFFWTPPLGVQGYYKCTGHTIRPLGGGKSELTATFEQSFQP